MALLRPERWKILVPVSQRHDIQPGRPDLRLVVQRQVRIDDAALRAERASLQVHTTDNAEIPGGLSGPRGRQVSRAQVQGDGGQDEGENEQEGGGRGGEGQAEYHQYFAVDRGFEMIDLKLLLQFSFVHFRVKQK